MARKNILSREEATHFHLCRYLDLQYPHVLYNTDLSGVKLPYGLAVKVSKLRKGRGWPDLMLFEPRGGYYGLFLEVKREGEEVYTKKGTPKSKHIKEQEEMMIELRKRGYYAVFCLGFDHGVSLIKKYMSYERTDWARKDDWTVQND